MNTIVNIGRGHSKKLKGAESHNSKSGNEKNLKNIRKN